MVGADQILAPEGPNIFVPAAVLPTGCGSASIVYVFQSSRPVAASRATSDPRAVQHS